MTGSENSEVEADISVEDIRAINFEEIFAKAQPEIKYLNCFYYERVLTKEAQKAADTGDIKRQKVCELFAVLCSFELGSVDISSHPNQNADKVQKARI